MVSPDREVRPIRLSGWGRFVRLLAASELWTHFVAGDSAPKAWGQSPACPDRKAPVQYLERCRRPGLRVPFHRFEGLQFWRGCFGGRWATGLRRQPADSL